MHSSCTVLLLVVLVSVAAAHLLREIQPLQPDQVHLSYGDSPSEMVVTWNTQNLSKSVVVYHDQKTTYLAYGNATLFVDGGNEQRKQYVHRVRLTGLKPGQKYLYRCGGAGLWSDQFYFTTMKSGSDWSPRLAIYGDLGMINPQSLPRLVRETANNMYDAVLHVGDFAYNMDDDNGRVGDEFMRQIEDVAAYLPYMTCPGNHEQIYNFSNYKARFSMPGSENNMMYSFNMGPIHFISISTEYYYFLYYGVKQIFKQYEWFENDLKEAAKPENRAVRPWIIVYGHRPMYCTNTDHDDCTKTETRVRVGIPFIHWLGLEKLLHKYSVDLAIWAHEHSYERLWPVYEHKVYNGSYEEPYRNPGATVHITTGSAGCQERHDPFMKDVPEWSAFRSDDYGYTRLLVANKTHIYLEQVSDDKNGDVIDKIWLIRDNHGPFTHK